MQEIRCVKCNKKLGEILKLEKQAIAMNDNKTVEKVELDKSGNVKLLEAQCPRCKTLNKVMI